eukprot:8847940-Alexandrium_andersonii.AAC.1
MACVAWQCLANGKGLQWLALQWLASARNGLQGLALGPNAKGLQGLAVACLGPERDGLAIFRPSQPQTKAHPGKALNLSFAHLSARPRNAADLLHLPARNLADP